MTSTEGGGAVPWQAQGGGAVPWQARSGNKCVVPDSGGGAPRVWCITVGARHHGDRQATDRGTAHRSAPGSTTSCSEVCFGLPECADGEHKHKGVRQYLQPDHPRTVPVLPHRVPTVSLHIRPPRVACVVVAPGRREEPEQDKDGADAPHKQPVPVGSLGGVSEHERCRNS